MREVIAVFLRLGVTAFGGPAAHIAMMRDELVRRRGWVDDRRFLDLMSATNLIPGPNSTELAIHLGYDRARSRGLVAAGVCFILPAALMVTGLAWAYVKYGDTPAIEGILYGVVPVVVAIVAHAVTGLGRSVLKTAQGWLLTVGAFAAYLLGVNELVILAAGAAIAATLHAGKQARGAPALTLLPMLVATGNEDLGRLFWTMLKIGSILYGSGYVLIAFLQGDFVDRLHWITQQQLADAVSIGQVTPGPVFTTATFVGYLVAGVPGAVVATIAIFLPSFLFVGLLTKLTAVLRARPWTAAVLDGLNATALGLIAGVGVDLLRDGIVDVLTGGIAAIALLVLLRFKLNSAWLITAGALVGLAHAAL